MESLLVQSHTGNALGFTVYISSMLSSPGSSSISTTLSLGES